MDKRGSHADWAISMGIFLVYLLVLFIIIRPGIEKVHNEDVLLDIVEEGLSEDVKWVVKMTPVIVSRCNAGIKRTISVKIDDGSNAWEFGAAKTDKIPQFGKFCFSNWELKCGEGECATIKSRTIFDLYYTPKEKDIEPKLDAWCTQQATESQCKVELGSTENLEGINWRWLNDLKSEKEEDYIKIKDEWNFPESKNFAIFVDGDKIIGEEPYENINVFVREWKDWYVYSDGERKETKVNIQVW